MICARCAVDSLFMREIVPQSAAEWPITLTLRRYRDRFPDKLAEHADEEVAAAAWQVYGAISQQERLDAQPAELSALTEKLALAQQMALGLQARSLRCRKKHKQAEDELASIKDSAPDERNATRLRRSGTMCLYTSR